MSSAALGIGSGLARGLANVLVAKRQEDQAKAVRQEERQAQNALAAANFLIQSGRVADYSEIQPLFDLAFGTTGKKAGKGAVDPHAILSNVLAPALQRPTAAAETAAQAGTQAADTMAQFTGDQPVLPSRPAVSPGTPAAPVHRQTLFGVPLLSDAEMTARDADRARALATAQGDAQTDAKLAAAARLRQVDPSMSVEDSLIAVGLKVPQDQFATIPQGGGVLNKSTGEIIEPPSSRIQNIPGALGERTRELLSVHPDWSEDQAKREAATQLATERTADREAREANTQSIQASRALQQTLLQMQANLGGVTPNNAAAMATQLRRDWTKAVQPFQDRQTYVAKLNSMIEKDPQGKTGIQRDRNAATQTIINSFNRLLEEGNVVREGEYARSEELAPLSTWLEAQITALSQGGGRLTDAQLESIAKEGIRIAGVTGSIFENGLRETRRAMTSQLGRYNIPVEDVFGNSTIASPYAATLDGRTFYFPTQAKLDTFKRQYPNAQ